MITVKVTKTINVPAKIVWQKVKDFDDIDKLLSVVNTCSVEGSVVSAGIAGMATKALGNAAIRYFIAKEPIDKVKQDFKESLKELKKEEK